MTPGEMVIQREKEFSELYAAFKGFYQEQLKKDATAFAKYKMHLSTQFFETYHEMHKVVDPLFKVMLANPDEKRAVARAALLDALLEHATERYLASKVQDMSTIYYQLESKFDALKEKFDDAISGRKQTRKGTEAEA